MSHHTLKIESGFYNAKIAGDKTFEVRWNVDKDFQKGDTVAYVDQYGHRQDHLVWEITYVTNFEQKPGWVVFADTLKDEDES